jgi:hypothetical protein
MAGGFFVISEVDGIDVVQESYRHLFEDAVSRGS